MQPEGHRFESGRLHKIEFFENWKGEGSEASSPLGKSFRAKARDRNLYSAYLCVGKISLAKLLRAHGGCLGTGWR